MAQAALKVQVEPPRRLRGWNGLIPTLQAVGMVDEYASEEPDANVDEYGDPRPDLLGSPRNIIDLAGDGYDVKRWEAGTTWRPVGYGELVTFTPCLDLSKDTSPPVDNVIQFPVDLVADDECSTWGNSNTPSGGYDFAERKRRALANLLRHQSNQLATELWTGAAAAAQGWPNLSLSQSATALLPPGMSSPLTLALGALQDSLAESLGDGQVGIIHATRSTVTQWWAAGALYWNLAGEFPGGGPGEGIVPNVMYDAYGNLVIASGGYDGSDPDGIVTDGVPWAYASGPIRVQLGGVRFVSDEESQDIARDVNLETVRAERSAVTIMDEPSIVGVGVNLCCTSCSEGS